MNKFTAILAIIGFFGVLSVCSVMNFPEGQYDGEMTRGLRTLDFLVHTVATDNLGNIGGAVLYGVMGLFSAGLVAAAPTGGSQRIKRASTKPSQPRKTTKPAQLSPPTPLKTARQRSITASSLAAGETAQIPGEETSDNQPEYEDVWTPEEVEAILNFEGDNPPMSADDRTSPVPAWGLMLGSPFKDCSGATSWLGGLPCAPQGFDWPRDPEDGELMHFYAQIDLNDLKPEPETGARPAGLPEKGALLVFIRLGCAVRVISEEDAPAAGPISAPDDLPELKSMGYWVEGNTFPAWPIKPRAFLDHPIDEEVFWEEMDGEARPAPFPNPHPQPSDWITTWGMAALEADVTIAALAGDMRLADDHAMGISHDHIRGYYAVLLEDGAALMERLVSWKARADSEDPLAPVDQDALSALFTARKAFCAKVDRNFTATIALNGAPYKVWEKVRHAARGDMPFAAFGKNVDPAHQRFAEERITDWRRHRLFGIEPPFSNNQEDLRGKACLISIGADELLGTQTEHDYGLSLWGSAEDLQAGHFDRLEVMRHCAV